MILHTILPQEAIFQNYYFTNESHNTTIVNYEGIPVLVEILGNEAIVKQIASTDPQHYLHKSIVPGAKIPLPI